MSHQVLKSLKFKLPIILLGYMGSGKSTVGRLLAKRLALPFVDLDDYLSEIHSSSVPNLFLKYSEIGFRKLEKKALDDLLVRNEAYVLSLGGGTPCYSNNMKSMIQSTPHTFTYLRRFQSFATDYTTRKTVDHCFLTCHLKKNYKNLFQSIFLKENSFMSRPITFCLYMMKRRLKLSIR